MPGDEDFIQDTLKFNMWEVSQLFEQWCCSKAKCMLLMHVLANLPLL
jgi:hypothetical protein